MDNYLEIKWIGRAGQGVVTAATVLAEVLARAGKYVQAFPHFDAQIQPHCLKAYNRLSTKPIKNHSTIKNADIVALMDPAFILNSQIGKNTSQEAIYIINTSYSPQWVKEKFSVPFRSIYTIDANLIALEEIGAPIPNIPMMAVLIQCIDWIKFEDFREKLEQSLFARWADYPERVLANLNTLQRALLEVKELKTDS